MDGDPRVRYSAPSQASSTPSSVLSVPQTHQYYDGTTTNPQSPHSLGRRDTSPLDHGGGSISAAVPGSTASAAAAAADGMINDPLADSKRPRACEACRQLKVRCDPDSENPDGPCKRCAKANRHCVVTQPTRKRQKKADSRVAELEKKIDALTASLHASRAARNHTASIGGLGNNSNLRAGSEEELPGTRWLGQQQGQSSSRHGVDARRSTGGGPSLGASSTSLAGNKRNYSGDLKSRMGSTNILVPLAARSHSPATESSSTFPDGSTAANGDSGALPSWPPLGSIDTAPKARYDHEYTDVIDRGIVDTETALKTFNRYVNEISPLLPFVVFPPGTTMSEVRRTKPVLFLAILSIAIGTFQPHLQTQLVNEVHRIYADQTIVKGTKSLELVQAIVISTIWYLPPDHYEELKFFQLIHIAAVMGMDLGMNRRTKTKSKSMGMWREIMGKKAIMLDPDAPETRRAWLGCYFMSVNISMSLRRPLLTRWQPYMDECLEILETSPDALPSDKAIIQWVKLAHIGEEIGFQFSMDDPATNVSITDPKIQYALKGFEGRLDEWRQEVPPDCYTPIMRHYELIINVYMHEIGMHADHNIDDFKPPFVTSLNTETSADFSTAAHVDAMTCCLTSIHKAYDIFTSIPYITIQCLPTIHMVRTAYASVALIKLFTTTSAPSSRLGQVFNPADFKVEYYLDRVIQHMKVPGETNGGRVPAKFGLMLNMLKTWFIKRKEGKQASASGGIIPFFQPKDLRLYTAPESTEDNEADKDRDEPGGATNSTSLQLLGEAALQTNNPSMNQPNQQAHHDQSRNPNLLHPNQSQIPNSHSHMHLDTTNPGPLNPVTTVSGTMPSSSAADSLWHRFPTAPVGMGILPSSTPTSAPLPNDHSNSTLPPQQYVQQMQTQPFVSSGLMEDAQAFMLDPDIQLAFQSEDELMALGNMWDDIFFPFPLDGSGAPI
ncbi:hypothetical protein FQN53_000446 [Emmonsiellopsis sp. PD_33]|nr:hypothetical protein FQN53_000446 [Emmonsiellopsis sp. PD_33]